MMLTNFNIFGFGDLKLVFLQIGWSYLDTSGNTMIELQQILSKPRPSDTHSGLGCPL